MKFANSQDEIDRKIKANSQSGSQKVLLRQIQNLFAERNLAIRRDDMATAEDYERQIRDLGGDPYTGDVINDGPVKDDPMAKINERNKKATQDAHRRAHAAEFDRIKQEKLRGGEPEMIDPSARVKMRLRQHEGR